MLVPVVNLFLIHKKGYLTGFPSSFLRLLLLLLLLLLPFLLPPLLFLSELLLAEHMLKLITHFVDVKEAPSCIGVLTWQVLQEGELTWCPV